MNILDIKWQKLTPKQLVDLCGAMATLEKQLNARRKEIGEKLIGLCVLPLAGDAFKGQVVEATTQWHLNRETLILEMGQDWVEKRSKPSVRPAYVLTRALPSVTTALKGIAA